MLLVVVVIGSSNKKPHGHKGVLEVYNGKPIPFKVTSDQNKKLEKGEAVSLTLLSIFLFKLSFLFIILQVTFNERTGKSGRGVVIQDINATQSICMSKIRDLPMYPKVVPHVKSVNIYESKKFINGTSKTGAKFEVGLLGMRFGYFLLLTHEPFHNTLTWTLDYKYNSDFDDNVGHWQVMPHPTKKGWSRVLYSTKVKLFNWIPEFVVKFLTTKALTESTSWVKRESENEQKKILANQKPAFKFGDAKLPKWLQTKGGFVDNNNDIIGRPWALFHPKFRLPGCSGL